MIKHLDPSKYMVEVKPYKPPEMKRSLTEEQIRKHSVFEQAYMFGEHSPSKEIGIGLVREMFDCNRSTAKRIIKLSTKEWNES